METGKAMNVQPLVSIIIPAYNAENYLAQAIVSAINQTWPAKEIIIVNDGSTDHTLNIAKQYESKNVIVLDQENKGASASRNLGLSYAKGEYIQFLDADDILSPDKIAKQIRLLESNPDKLAVCSTVHFNDGTNYSDSKPSASEEAFLINAAPLHFIINLWGGYSMHGSMVQPNAWLAPRHIIDKAGPWNEQITVDDDGEYFCRVIFQSAGVIKSEGYNYYRRYNNQASLSAKKNLDNYDSLLRSSQLKKQYLLSRTSCYEANAAVYKMLMQIITACYLKYPDIVKRAELELPAIKLPEYLPPVGGKISTFITKLLGWKAARLLSEMKQRLLSYS